MRVNVTMPDRVARLSLSIALLGLAAALDGPWTYLALVGLSALGTALTGFCPVYAAVGWNESSSRGDHP